MSVDLRHKINAIYTHIELILGELAVLKKELADSDASNSSARKGVLPEEEKSKIIRTRQKRRMNQSFQKDTK